MVSIDSILISSILPIYFLLLSTQILLWELL